MTLRRTLMASAGLLLLGTFASTASASSWGFGFGFGYGGPRYCGGYAPAYYPAYSYCAPVVYTSYYAPYCGYYPYYGGYCGPRVVYGGYGYGYPRYFGA